jgi:hypothetical protein
VGFKWTWVGEKMYGVDNNYVQDYNNIIFLAKNGLWTYVKSYYNPEQTKTNDGYAGPYNYEYYYEQNKECSIINNYVDLKLDNMCKAELGDYFKKVFIGNKKILRSNKYNKIYLPYHIMIIDGCKLVYDNFFENYQPKDFTLKDIKKFYRGFYNILNIPKCGKSNECKDNKCKDNKCKDNKCKEDGELYQFVEAGGQINNYFVMHIMLKCKTNRIIIIGDDLKKPSRLTALARAHQLRNGYESGNSEALANEFSPLGYLYTKDGPIVGRNAIEKYYNIEPKAKLTLRTFLYDAITQSINIEFGVALENMPGFGADRSVIQLMDEYNYYRYFKVFADLQQVKSNYQYPEIESKICDICNDKLNYKYTYKRDELKACK